MTHLDLQSIGKSFDKTPVLKDINLQVEQGEFLVLVGPSGCGKSTLINIISGLEDVSGGKILLNNTDITITHPKDRKMAMVFQNYALYPNMTVAQNMGFPLKMLKMSKSNIAHRVQQVAETLQIEHLLNRRPMQLSGGQKQRVAMGRALVRDAEIYLFDEPLSNLDAKLRTEMRSELKRLHASLKSTIIYVTHDQIEAMTLSTRIAILHEGNIAQIGTPRQVYTKPANMFVAGFIGSPKINFIPLNIQQDARTIVATPLQGDKKHRIILPSYLQSYVDKTVIMGIRPEHIHIPSAEKDNQQNNISAIAEIVDLTGPVVQIETQIFNTPCIACVSPDTHIKPQDTIVLNLNSKNAIFFDSNTKERIC